MLLPAHCTQSPSPRPFPSPLSLPLGQTLFRVSRNYDMEEKIKLEYMKVIGTAHMRILDGLDSLLQLSGLLAKLCLIQP